MEVTARPVCCRVTRECGPGRGLQLFSRSRTGIHRVCTESSWPTGLCVYGIIFFQFSIVCPKGRTSCCALPTCFFISLLFSRTYNLHCKKNACIRADYENHTLFKRKARKKLAGKFFTVLFAVNRRVEYACSHHFQTCEISRKFSYFIQSPEKF